MISPRLRSLQVGRPAPLPYRDGHVMTAIVKRSVTGPVALSTGGLAGDEQADRVNHGGPDKAVCGYPSEHYSYWSERLGRAMPAAAFGENFTTEGLVESELLIGDTFRVGSALVQVSQPRSPCFKLAARHGVKKLALWVQETGRSGFYFRVLEPGEVAAGQALELAERPAHGVTVADLNRVAYADGHDPAAVRRVLEATELTAAWREWLAERL